MITTNKKWQYPTENNSNLCKIQWSTDKAELFKGLFLFFNLALIKFKINWRRTELVHPLCSPWERLGEFDQGKRREAKRKKGVLLKLLCRSLEPEGNLPSNCWTRTWGCNFNAIAGRIQRRCKRKSLNRHGNILSTVHQREARDNHRVKTKPKFAIVF